MKCFDCGVEGHIAADCPNRELSADNKKPPWCGICDPRTRLVGNSEGIPMRCPDCHPRGGQHLEQFQRCPGCKMLIHKWDTAPCGHHSVRRAS